MSQNDLDNPKVKPPKPTPKPPITPTPKVNMVNNGGGTGAPVINAILNPNKGNPVPSHRGVGIL